MKLHNKIFLKYTLELLSGLHIGDSKESIEIGGVDNPIVRNKDTNEPYIPGSSLKGKIRSLLEIALGENGDNSFKGYKTEKGKIIERLFGSADYPARILVRESYLTTDKLDPSGELIEKGWATILKESEFTDMPYTEIKFENVINRLNGTAEHPRQIERIPAGAKFDVEFIINIIDSDEYIIDKKTFPAHKMSTKPDDYVRLLKAGISLLESDYLGGSGTRGYGQVMLTLKEEKIVNPDEYFNIV